MELNDLREALTEAEALGLPGDTQVLLAEPADRTPKQYEMDLAVVFPGEEEGKAPALYLSATSYEPTGPGLGRYLPRIVNDEMNA